MGDMGRVQFRVWGSSLAHFMTTWGEIEVDVRVAVGAVAVAVVAKSIERMLDYERESRVSIFSVAY